MSHPGVVSDQPGQIHRVINAGVVELECQLIILPDALPDFLQILDLHTVKRFFHAMVKEHLFVALFAQRLDFFEDLLDSHKGRGSQIMREKIPNCTADESWQFGMRSAFLAYDFRFPQVFAPMIDAWRSACTIPPPGGKAASVFLKILL